MIFAHILLRCVTLAALVGSAIAQQALPVGVTVRGSVSRSITELYLVSLDAPPVSPIRVVVVPISGDPDLVARVLPATNWQYSSRASSGTDRISIPPGSCPGTGVCSILIGVYGYSTASFTLVATTGSNSSTSLVAGVPRTDRVDIGDYAFYTLLAPAGTGKVQLRVTVFSGSPVLLVASDKTPGAGHTRPIMGSSSTYCRLASASQGSPVVAITNLTADADCWCAPPCTYYASVYGSTANGWSSTTASYTITGSVSADASVTTLLEGISQLGAVGAGGSAYFSFSATAAFAGAPIAELVLTPYSGSAGILVALNASVATAANAAYSSTASAPGSAIVRIRGDDAAVRARCPGSAAVGGPACPVAVTVSSLSSTWGATFAVVASSSGYFSLADSVAQYDVVAVGAYRFYRFFLPLTTPPSVFVVSLAPQSGSSLSLYVGNGNVSRPTNASSLWSAVAGIASSVAMTIDPGAPGTCAPPCFYYIGVTEPRRSASYRVTATVRSGRPMLIQAGVLTDGYVIAGEWARFYGVVDRSLPQFFVSASLPSRGSLGIAVAVSNSSGVLVSYANSQWAAAAAGGGIAEVALDTADPRIIAACGATNTSVCFVGIGVVGTSTSSFVVTLSGSVPELPDGVPVAGSLSSQTTGSARAEYVYTAADVMPVTIRVTRISGSATSFMICASLMIGVGCNYPRWSSQSALVINFGIPDLANATFPLKVYVTLKSVYYFSGVSAFTVQASSSGYTQLADGMPASQDGGAMLSGLALFAFTVPPGSAGFEVTASSLSGNPSLYVFVTAPGDPPFPICGNPCSAATVSNFRWSSSGNIMQSRATVPGTDRFWTAGTYGIAVFASASYGSQIVVTASMLNSTVLLQDGVPTSGQVSQGQYAFFRYALMRPLEETKVLFQVTPFSGDPDIYASANFTNARPTAARFDKSATGGIGQTDAVLFLWDDLQLCRALFLRGAVKCELFVGVFGFSDATFSIVGSASSNASAPVLLRDGEPQTGVVDQGLYRQYAARVSVPPGQSYYAYITVVAGSVQVYATNDGRQPNATSYDDAISGGSYFAWRSTSRHYKSNCTLRLAVYSAWGAQFSVLYAAQSTVVHLLPGLPLRSATFSNQILYYYYTHTVAAASVVFTLSPSSYSSRVSLYISVPWNASTPLPSSAQNCRSVVGVSGYPSQVTLSPNSACYCLGCNYVFGVQGSTYWSAGDTGFTIGVSTTGGVSQLADGVPYWSYMTSAGQYQYFSFDASAAVSARRNITFRVSPATSVVMGLTNRWRSGDSWLPNIGSNSSQWTSPTTGPSAGLVVVRIDDPARAGCASCTLYMVCVKSLVNFQASFSISALAGAPRVLRIGESTGSQTLVSRATLSFAVDIVDTSMDLSVVFSYVSGGPLTVSLSPDAPPTCGGSGCAGVWGGSVSTWSRTQVRINSQLPCVGPFVTGPCSASDWRPGRLYISAYSAAGAAFSFYIAQATPSSLQPLPAGVIQFGSVQSTATQTWAFISQYDPLQQPLRLAVGAGAASVVAYIKWCVAPRCTPADLTPGPGPGNSSISVRVLAASRASVVFSLENRNYCSDGAFPAQCVYAITVAPLDFCSGCDVRYTIFMQTEGGDAPTYVPFGGVLNSVLGRAGALVPATATTPSPSSVFEIYAPSDAPPARISLDACYGFPTLYVCSAVGVPAPGAPGCGALPSSPGPANYTAKNGTASGGGLAALSVPLTSAAAGAFSSTYFAVRADAASAPGGAPVRFWVSVSAGAAWLLEPPAAQPGVVEADAGAYLVWPPARARCDGCDAGVGPYAPLVGALYTVYIAPGSFQASADAASPGNGYVVVTTTPCGVAAWQGVTRGAVLSTNDTTLWLGSLLVPSSAYEVAVVVQCDELCWASSGLAAPTAGSTPLQGIQYAIAPLAAFTAPGVLPVPPVAPGPAAFPIAGIVAVALCAALLLACGLGAWRYRAAKAVHAAPQYTDLEIAAAMKSAAVDSGEEGGPDGARAAAALPRGAGFASRLQALMQKQRSEGLSEPLVGAQHSTTEDRIAAFLE